MQSELDFTPYRLNQYITDFRRQLLYIGNTYYERHLVFEHLNPLITQLLGIQVTSIELSFSEEKLIAISIFLNEKPENDEKLMKLIESRIGQKPKLVVDQVWGSAVGSHVYTWAKGDHKLALMTYWDTDQLFIQYSLKDF